MPEINNPNKVEYEFHYNRDERLSMMPEAVLKLKNKKKKNRSLLILWLDIALIVILSSGFLIYQKITGNRYSDEDFTFSMKTFVYNDNLLISVTALNKKPYSGQEKNPKDIPVELNFKLSKSESFYKKVFDILPLKKSNEKTYRISIPLSKIPDLQESTHVLVNIKYKNSSINIKHKIVYEK